GPLGAWGRAWGGLPIPGGGAGAGAGGRRGGGAACSAASRKGRYRPAEYARRLLSTRHLAPAPALPAISHDNGCESRSAEKRSKRTASGTGITKLEQP